MLTMKTILATLFIAVVLTTLASLPIQAQYGKAPKDWPCVQRYVPNLSAGVFWTGELPETQPQDTELDGLVKQISDPFSSLEESLMQVENFVTESSDNPQAATKLIVALNTTINHKRNRIIKGIERFSRRQKMMLRRMEKQSAEMEKIEEQPSTDQASKLEDLQVRQKWDIRVFEEREALLNNLCEQPVLLEQRFFSLGRYIANLHQEKKQ